MEQFSQITIQARFVLLFIIKLPQCQTQHITTTNYYKNANTEATGTVIATKTPKMSIAAAGQNKGAVRGMSFKYSSAGSTKLVMLPATPPVKSRIIPKAAPVEKPI